MAKRLELDYQDDEVFPVDPETGYDMFVPLPELMGQVAEHRVIKKGNARPGQVAADEESAADEDEE